MSHKMSTQFVFFFRSSNLRIAQRPRARGGPTEETYSSSRLGRNPGGEDDDDGDDDGSLVVRSVGRSAAYQRDGATARPPPPCANNSPLFLPSFLPNRSFPRHRVLTCYMLTFSVHNRDHILSAIGPKWRIVCDPYSHISGPHCKIKKISRLHLKCQPD